TLSLARALAFLFFSSTLPRPPSSPPFPYTTLFRSPPPIADVTSRSALREPIKGEANVPACDRGGSLPRGSGLLQRTMDARSGARSEEHTSELQSRENLVCRLLLEKKNRNVRAWHRT